MYLNFVFLILALVLQVFLIYKAVMFPLYLILAGVSLWLCMRILLKIKMEE